MSDRLKEISEEIQHCNDQLEVIDEFTSETILEQKISYDEDEFRRYKLGIKMEEWGHDAFLGDLIEEQQKLMYQLQSDRQDFLQDFPKEMNRYKQSLSEQIDQLQSELAKIIEREQNSKENK